MEKTANVGEQNPNCIWCTWGLVRSIELLGRGKKGYSTGKREVEDIGLCPIGEDSELSCQEAWTFLYRKLGTFEGFHTKG